MRPACSCCPDTVVVADDAACLPTTAAPACGRTALHRKVVAAAGTEAGDHDVYKSVEATVSALHVVIRAHTP